MEFCRKCEKVVFDGEIYEKLDWTRCSPTATGCGMDAGPALLKPISFVLGFAVAKNSFVSFANVLYGVKL